MSVKKRNYVLSTKIVMIMLFMSSCSYKTVDRRLTECDWDDSCKQVQSQNYTQNGSSDSFFWNYYWYSNYMSRPHYSYYGHSTFYPLRTRIASGESHLFTKSGQSYFKSSKFAGTSTVSHSFTSGSKGGLGSSSISRGGFGSTARSSGGFSS